MVLFADDSLERSGTTPTISQSVHLHQLEQWTQKWQTIFKPEKLLCNEHLQQTQYHSPPLQIEGASYNQLFPVGHDMEWRLTANSPGLHCEKVKSNVTWTLRPSNTPYMQLVLQGYCT